MDTILQSVRAATAALLPSLERPTAVASDQPYSYAMQQTPALASTAGRSLPPVQQLPTQPAQSTQHMPGRPSPALSQARTLPPPRPSGPQTFSPAAPNVSLPPQVRPAQPGTTLPPIQSSLTSQTTSAQSVRHPTLSPPNQAHVAAPPGQPHPQPRSMQFSQPHPGQAPQPPHPVHPGYAQVQQFRTGFIPGTAAPPAAPRTRPPDPRIANKRTAIMDPPERDVVMGNTKPGPSYPSPAMDHRRNPKFQDDLSRMTYAIEQSLPESVRRAIRENWEKCLLGTEFHQAFILNVALHHISPAAVNRSVRDFGRRLIDTAKEEIIGIMTTAEIDELAHLILPKASPRFLDLALEGRLRTIEAKPLINALARAERLGYEPDDIVEEAPSNGQERVIPQHQPSFPPPSQVQPLQPSQPPMTPSPANSGLPPPPPQPWKCDMCNRLFQYEEPYLYHMRKQICKRLPSNPQAGFKCTCNHCGQGFSTTLGRQYHQTNRVCGSNLPMYSQSMPNTPASATPSRPPAAPTAPALSQTATPSRPPKQQFDQGVYGSSQSQPTPQRSSPPSASKNDPYSHLSEEQVNELNDELQRAETSYGERMREAELLPDADDRRRKLEHLRNSFGTRQSTIRKKYGVRLRERRTRAAIDAERTRMLGRSNGGTPVPPSSGVEESSELPVALSSQASAGSGWTAANIAPAAAPAAAAPAAATPTPTPTVATPAAALAASPAVPPAAPPASDGHDAKRARVDDASRVSSSQDIHATPSKRKIPMAPSANTARMETTVSLTRPPGSARQPINRPASPPVPMDSSDSSSDNEDIPARLPAAVRQSLAH